jgi:hypothetical protein
LDPKKQPGDCDSCVGLVWAENFAQIIFWRRKKKFVVAEKSNPAGHPPMLIQTMLDNWVVLGCARPLIQRDISAPPVDGPANDGLIVILGIIVVETKMLDADPFVK